MRSPNGSKVVLYHDHFAQIIGVKHCPCEDGVPRRVYRVGVPNEKGYPDTMFSAPGYVSVRGKTVSGFITSDQDGWQFRANSYGKNAHLLKG